ncbi:MAG: HEAT repeat domain-containing protein [Pirellulales bacterium]
MGKSKSVSEKRGELNALRDRAKSAEAVNALQTALADRSNRVVAKAAEIIAESENQQLEDDLKEAYRRLLVEPVKSDPGCLGKTAIAEALVKLECRDIDFYRSGIQYVQHEPTWGGNEDAAAQLRAVCAAGLVLCASLLEALDRFAQLLTDPAKTARIGAARAIASLGHAEGGPLVRLKLLLGDKEPEVVGECCAALLQLAPESGLPLVLDRLASPDADVAIQVAMALAESRNRKAFEPLRAAWKRQRDPEARATLLLAIGLLRFAEANEFLLSLVRGRDASAAGDALRALKVHGKSGDLRQQIEAAVHEGGNPNIISLFGREFGA